MRSLPALSDGHWRVREMAARVIGDGMIGDALDGVTTLREKPVPGAPRDERAIATPTTAGS